MTRRAFRGRRVVAALLVAGIATLAAAADIGQVKLAKGRVTVERGGQALPATVGMRVQASDTVQTGADGSVGITMSDNSLLSAGPNSTLTLARYEYDETTSQGRFDTTLTAGSLAVVSGRIAKQSPDAMTVRTPRAILGVRGTEFVVSIDDPASAVR
jgi:hypothetical protein